MYHELSIQIVNYNTKNYLIQCVKDVISDLQFSDISYKILIVDNNSKDDITDLLELYKGTDIAVFRSDVNLGFGGGHNYLFRLVQSPYVLILNPDIEIIEKNTIKTLLSFLKENPGISIIGPKLVSDNYQTIEYDHGELKGFKSWYKNNLGEVHWYDRNKTEKVAWVCGAFFLIRNEVYKKVNGFDQNFFLYKEEEDLCYRCRELGFHVYYFPFVKVLHHSEVSSKRSDHIEESKRYYIKKNLEHKLQYKLLSIIRKYYRMIRYSERVRGNTSGKTV